MRWSSPAPPAVAGRIAAGSVVDGVLARWAPLHGRRDLPLGDAPERLARLLPVVVHHSVVPPFVSQTLHMRVPGSGPNPIFDFGHASTTFRQAVTTRRRCS